MKLVLSKSACNTYWQCEKRYGFAYRDGLVPKTKEKYFVVGDLFHLGLAIGYTTHNPDKIHEKTIQYVLDTYPSARQGTMPDELQDQITEAMRLVSEYFDHYGFEEDVRCLETTRVEVKIGQIGDLEVFYSGRIDALKGNNILEHKTMGSISSRTIQSYHHDPQGVGYKLLWPEADNVIYNLISKAQNPKIKFHREEVLLPTKLVEDYKKFLMRTAERMLPILNDLKDPDRNLFACVPIVGGQCPYRPICFIKDPEHVKRMKQAYFEIVGMAPDMIGYDKYLKEG